MRFRFCGDNDCEDWVLPQIACLSKLTSIKMKLLCNEVMTDLVDSNINFEKMIKLTSEAKLDAEDVKASAAALAFILSSSAKFHVDSDMLCNELQQLGLPKEHSLALCRVYSDNFDRLQNALKRQTMTLNRLKKIECEIVSEFTSNTHKVNAPTLKINLETQFPHLNICKHSFFVTNDKLSALIYELRQALQSMDELII